MAVYRRLTTDLSDLIDDEETFRLFTLLLLFSDVDDHSFPKSVKDLQMSYFNVIRRRLCHLLFANNLEQETDLALGNMVYSRFSTLIIGIKQMTNFVHKLFSQLKKPPQGTETAAADISEVLEPIESDKEKLVLPIRSPKIL